MMPIRGKIFFVSIFVIATVTVSMAATLYVPADAATIQQAINVAQNGDMIVVSPGTYYENLDFLGKTITVTSEAGPDVTIIDGRQLGPVVNFHSGEGAGSEIIGFTVQNGNGSYYNGGGVSISGSSPTITGNYIVRNTACEGAGVYVYFGSPLIQQNAIMDNHQGGCSGGPGGGGVLLGGAAQAQIWGNYIGGNSTGSDGGGIALFAAGTPTIAYNWIAYNGAQSGGGISLGNYSDAEILNNVITKNGAFYGGGISWLVPYGNRGPRLVNNTIADNDANGYGSGIFADGYDVQTPLYNNIILGKSGQAAIFCGNFNDVNPPAFFYNDVYGPGGGYAGVCSDPTGSNGNISRDPMFLDAVNDDYHLQSISPVIDMGDNAAASELATDFDGNPRIMDGNMDGIAIVDMGAFEALTPAISGSYRFSTFDPPGSVDTVIIGLDDSGQYVGNFTDANGVTHGFLRKKGDLTILDYPEATYTSARGINSSGRVTGFYIDAAGIYHGFIWSRGTYQKIDVPGAVNTQPLGINASGQLAGAYDKTGAVGESYGFYGKPPRFTVFEVPFGSPATTVPYGISANGKVVGTYGDAEGNSHGFLYDGKTFRKIEFPGVLGGTFPLGINARGTIVGRYLSGPGGNRGFVLVNGLSWRFAYPNSGATAAYGINEPGQICGFYRQQGVRHGFIATPIPKMKPAGVKHK